MNALIYSPSNLRAIDQQSQADLLQSLGYEVMLLTWAPKGVLHCNMEVLGVKTYSSHHVKGRSIVFFIKQALYLVRFCRRHKIDILFAHLQSNAIAAGLARPFLKTRMIYVRHNADYLALKAERKGKVLNALANKLSPEIMAISNNVREQLIKEGVSLEKILRVNLCYDFSQYNGENTAKAVSLRQQWKADFVLIYVARLDRWKRHELAFAALKALLAKGHNCKMVCIGEGDYRPQLEQWIVDHEMQDVIILQGFVTNVLDYIEASDVLLLLSYSEASSHAVKEAGLCEKPVIVCKSVGDFEEYVTDGVNGFLVDKEQPVKEAIECIEQLMANPPTAKGMGKRLRQSVLEQFGIEGVTKQYLSFINKANDKIVTRETVNIGH